MKKAVYQNRLQAVILKETKTTITAEVTFMNGTTEVKKFKKSCNNTAIEITTGNLVPGRLSY